MKIRDDISLGQHSHVGMARTANEDFFGYWEPDDDREFDLKGRLVIVCDGMGGHTGGEIASRLAVKTIIEAYQNAEGDDIVENLRTAIEKANAAVFAEARRQPELKGMGTTVTAIVQRRDIVYFGQVGDSRAYLIRGGAMKQMTKDHSLVQQLVDEGLLDASEMENHPDKNVILRSLGVKPEVDVDISHVPIVDDDTLLLCSDGLTGLVSDEEILRTVSAADGKNLRQVCEELIDKANAAGGHDNITVQILKVHRTASATTDTTPPETVTQSFTPDQVAASIARARAEAEARGAAPTSSSGGSSPSLAPTAPSMPAPTLAPAPSGGSGRAPAILGGALLGALIGLGVGMLFAPGNTTDADAPALERLLDDAKACAAAAGLAPADLPATEGRSPAEAARAYLTAAIEAQREAALEARTAAEAKSEALSQQSSPLVLQALEALKAGTVALQEKHYAEARARFEAAQVLFAAAEAAQ
ncbi:MAG: Stp1/IreP family PP2C-type Ser/Thr phosphatase [Planctomycetota bacterium]|nr:MAG: Stp1/IreP family PP2C-type Ser/Thr phosphatase [Planctomycetota bacterium]